MIFYAINIRTICLGLLVIPLIFVGCMIWAYIVNEQRPIDDPEKKDYELGAIFIAPFTIPFLVALGILLFVVRAILFAMYLVTLAAAMVLIRKPLIIAWLEKVAIKIGDPLMKVNTQLFRLARAQWNPGSA